MDKHLDSLNRLEGYIKFAKDDVPLSANDFGTTLLKKKIRSRDVEGTLKNLQLVNANIEKYHEPLVEQGLPSETIKQFSEAFSEIDTDNQKQYEIVSTRRILTAENINSLNALYAQMMEICEIGKMLYKKTQKVKLPDYTFSYLVKKVRIS